VYQLSPEVIESKEEEEFSPRHLRGRFLFGKDINFNVLSNRLASGAVVKATRLTGDFNFETFQKIYGKVGNTSVSHWQNGEIDGIYSE